MHWRACKSTGSPLFDGPVSEWDVNKVRLVYWSSLYDSVYESPDRPPQYIIDDNKLLDEWFEAQTEELEERAEKNYREKYRQGKATNMPSAYNHQTVFTIKRSSSKKSVVKNNG